MENYGNESNESILEAYGIVTKDKQSLDVLKPRQCPNCLEPNKPDAKCRMVLTYDGYSETLESEKQKDDKLTLMENTVNTMQAQIQSLISSFSSMREQTQVDSMARTLYGSGLIKAAGKAAYHATTTKSALTKEVTSAKTKVV